MYFGTVVEWGVVRVADSGCRRDGRLVGHAEIKPTDVIEGYEITEGDGSTTLLLAPSISDRSPIDR